MRQLLVIISILFSLNTEAQLLFTKDFEVGSVTSGWTFAEFCCAHTAVISTHRKRLGNNAARIELRREDPLGPFGGKRAEWSLNSSSPVFWKLFSFSFYAARDSNVIDQQPYLFWQVKQGSGGISIDGSPPIGLVVNRDSLELHIRYANTAMPNANNNATNLTIIKLGLLPYDRWNDVVFEYNYNSTSAGNLKLWLNGVQRVNYNGPNYYEGANHPYIKLGMYRWIWQNANYGNSTSNYGVFYYDEVKWAGATSSYQDIALPPIEVTPPPSQGERSKVRIKIGY